MTADIRVDVQRQAQIFNGGAIVAKVVFQLALESQGIDQSLGLIVAFGLLNGAIE